MTAGGDCPGLNAVIRAVTRRGLDTHGATVIGIRNGWDGLMENNTIALGRDHVRGIAQQGGTILGTSRRDPYEHGDGFTSLRDAIEANGIETLIVTGGDGTLRTALRLEEEGLSVVGIPKTIDNDIAGTDMTFGFNTAVQIATDAIDRVTTTAEAHERLMLVEVMGRTKGWIATWSGIAAGAHAILTPEFGYDLDEVADTIRSRTERGRTFSVVVVAEGVDPPPGQTAKNELDAYGFERLGGVAYQIAPELEERCGIESRVTVLGHVQRGGVPTAFDRVLATRLGVKAVDLAVEGVTGVMTALRGDEIIAVSLEEACSDIKGVPPGLYDVAATFFG